MRPQVGKRAGLNKPPKEAIYSGRNKIDYWVLGRIKYLKCYDVGDLRLINW